MFGFGKHSDPDIRRLRKEGSRIVRENHRLRAKVESLEKNMNIMREEMRRLQAIIKEYQEMLFKKKALRYNKKDDHDDNDRTPKKPGAPIGREGTSKRSPKES